MINQHPQPDAKLDALLDEALSPDRVPGGIPADLDARIMAALPLHTLQAQEQAVIGRVGFFSSLAVRRIAAALLVVMGIAATIIGFGALHQAALEADKAKQTLATKEATQQRMMEKLTSDIEQAPITLSAARELHNTTFALTTAAMTDSALDHSIDTLKSRTDHAALTAGVDSWSSVAQSLEAELDALEFDGFQG